MRTSPERVAGKVAVSTCDSHSLHDYQLLSPMPSLPAHLPHMRYRHILLALALLPIASAANAIEPSDLKPGLVASYRDPRNDAPSPSVTRLEPTVAITLAKGESPHP